MDLIRKEFMLIYDIESCKGTKYYEQNGMYCKKNNLVYHDNLDNINVFENIIPISYFETIFKKYDNMLKKRKLKYEIKLHIEQGKKEYFINDNHFYYYINRYSINFAIWSNYGIKYDRGFGSTNDVEYINNLESELLRLYNEAIAEINDSFFPGYYDVVLDSEATGLLVHEIIGHCLEADIYNNNEKINDFFNFDKRVSNLPISIVDNPKTKNGYGNYLYDDEGTIAQEVHLIEAGYFKELLTSNDFSDESNGHGRALNFNYSPIVRMSNTYMLPGKREVSSIFKSINQGIYLCGSGDSVGGFDFNMRFPICYKIRNGKVLDRIPALKMYGNVKNTLMNIADIANDFKILGGGDGGCGKMGQWPLPVSSGGPHLRINKMLLMEK